MPKFFSTFNFDPCKLLIRRRSHLICVKIKLQTQITKKKKTMTKSCVQVIRSGRYFVVVGGGVFFFHTRRRRYQKKKRNRSSPNQVDRGRCETRAFLEQQNPPAPAPAPAPAPGNSASVESIDTSERWGRNPADRSQRRARDTFVAVQVKKKKKTIWKNKKTKNNTKRRGGRRRFNQKRVLYITITITTGFNDWKLRTGIRIYLAIFSVFFWKIYQVLLGFHWILVGLTGFGRVWLGFTGFYWVLLGFIGFLWLWLGLTKFYWVWQDFPLVTTFTQLKNHGKAITNNKKPPTGPKSVKIPFDSNLDYDEHRVIIVKSWHYIPSLFFIHSIFGGPSCEDFLVSLDLRSNRFVLFLRPSNWKHERHHNWSHAKKRTCFIKKIECAQ